MIRFHRTELLDLQDQLPVLLDESSFIATEAEFDLLVCVNGFEERTAAIPKWLAEHGQRIPHTAVVVYPTNLEDNDRTRGALQESVGQVSSTTHDIHFKIPAPELRSELRKIVEQSSSKGQIRILFDISGASGALILRLTRTFFELARQAVLDVNLTIAYAEAEHYSPTQEAAEELIEQASANGEATLGLDFDAEELTPTVEYPGHHLDTVADRAVVICGFNADRVRTALDHIDTAFNIDFPHARVTYIAGKPPREADAWRLNAMVKINSLPAVGQLAVQQASTLDYLETLRRLEAQYLKSFGKERITVLPFGSKMQSVATALFCELRSDVKVQLVAPARYTGVEYSTGVGPLHILPMGSLIELINTLGRIGQIEEISGGQ
jgi:hypothetical protein